MKVFKIISASVLPIFLSANLAFTTLDLPCLTVQYSHNYLVENESISARETEQDPIKRLQGKKEKIQKLFDEGKLTREEAEAKIRQIDEKIKKIEEFNKLPLNKKKEKLIENFRNFTDDMVKKGKITRERADELLKEYESKVNQWDGSGKPPMFKKGRKCPLKKKN